MKKANLTPQEKIQRRQQKTSGRNRRAQLILDSEERQLAQHEQLELRVTELEKRILGIEALLNSQEEMTDGHS